MMAAPCAIASAVLLTLSLTGCGETASGGSAEVTTSATSPSPSPSRSPSTATTTQPAPPPPQTTAQTSTPGKQDVYVVLRMDDFAANTLAQEQADSINWAIENKVAFSFGIVAKDWPKDCLTNEGGQDCDSLAVQAVNKAYKDGHILGTGDDAFLEICNHDWGHDTWAANYKQKAYVQGDFEKSDPVIREAYPKASIRTFIAPETIADTVALEVQLEHKYDIMSTQAQLGCNQTEGEAPNYNYWFTPCEGQCVPPKDTYFTQDGMQKLENGIISLPTGSANSHVANPDIGRSVDVTIGVGECGCTGDEKCPLLQNAYQNSRKSNGLWWTVLMMHPQTSFQKCCKQSYRQWLDEFIDKVRALEDYAVHFVTFQGLADLKAPQATSMSFV